jgi:hypothetical protein
MPEVEQGGGKMTEGCGERWRRRGGVGEEIDSSCNCWRMKWVGFMISVRCCHSNMCSPSRYPSKDDPHQAPTLGHEPWALQRIKVSGHWKTMDGKLKGGSPHLGAGPWLDS